MMPSYFEKKLIELLPPLYPIEDESGDLQSFLNVTAPSLDDLKDLIDRFPQIFDVDQFEERFLPHLAGLVGMPFDGTQDPTAQRRRIKEAIPFYQRKGTIPGIQRSLANAGQSVEIEETFRRALRLNSRPSLNGRKLPGRVFSLGVFRVISDSSLDGLREALEFHQPAGTRVFFWQRLWAWASREDELTALNKVFVRRLLLGELNEAFQLNHTPLASCFHLTRKQKVFSVFEMTSGSTLMPDFDYASTCLASWHGRGDRMRLGRKALNTRMLANCWESERKFAKCCEVQARRRPPRPLTPLRLNRGDLNETLLNRSNIECRVRFMQKDYYGETPGLDVSSVERGVSVTRSSDSRLSRWFRLGRSRVSGQDHLTGKFKAAMFICFGQVDVQWGGVTEAWNLVDRWRRRGLAFSLNANSLNTRYLTDANITEERASFELRVQTPSNRPRIATLRLNNRELNQSGLRLSVQRTHPLRLGRMALNQSGPRLSRPNLIWRFRQKDFHMVGEPVMSADDLLQHN